MWDDLENVDVFAALADYVKMRRDHRDVNKIKVGKEVADIIGLQNLNQQQLRELGKVWDGILRHDLKKQQLTHGKDEGDQAIS
jgi:hypothetical protein